MEALALLLALAIGLTLGLLGAGGSILTVPIFVYLLGYGAKPAIAMTLPVVGTASLVGAARHWRVGNVNVREALKFGVMAMAGAYAGARLAVLVSAMAQLTLLAMVMFAAAVSMLRRPHDVARARERTRGSRGLVPVVGLSVGLLTGIVGIGGGFLIVPALVILADLPMKQAIGTSLVVIGMTSASGLAGYVNQVEIPWGFVAVFTAVAIAGILVGTHLVRFVSQQALKRAFAALLLIIGSLILYQNRGVFAPPSPSGEPDHAAQAIL